MTTKSRRASALSRRATLRAGAVLAASAATLPLATAALAAPEIGKPAPDFTATDTNGVPRSLAGLKGKIVVLEWTNADCPFTQKHYKSSNMQSLQREAAASGVVWLTVISSAPGEQGYVDATKANALTSSRSAAPAGVVLDPSGKIGRAYDAQTTPHMYIIGTDGRLLYMGGIDSIMSTDVADVPKAKPFFRDALQAVVKGQAVPVAVTRPYGCNVKYSS